MLAHALAPLALFLALSATGPAPTPATCPQQDALDASGSGKVTPASMASLFRPAQGGMTVSPGSTIRGLVEDYCRLTGETFVYDEQAQSLMDATKVLTSGAIEVPQAEVQTCFQHLLLDNGFVLEITRLARPRLLKIVSLNSPARNTMRGAALTVDVEHLEAMRAYPAILISTVVDLPNTDVRQLSNSMRTMITDANTQQMLPAGNSNSMVLTGFTTRIADLVTILRRIDEASSIEGVPSVSSKVKLARVVLEHAPAAEALAIVMQLVGGVPQGVAQAAQGGPAVFMEPPVRVVADPRTNAILVAGSAEQIARVLEAVAIVDAE